MLTHTITWTNTILSLASGVTAEQLEHWRNNNKAGQAQSEANKQYQRMTNNTTQAQEGRLSNGKQTK